MPAAEEMRVGALAPWFGGKRTLAPAICVELGRHTQFFDPMCGSMAVLFAKEPSQKETVNDLHGDIINLARVVAAEDTAEMLYNRLQRVVFSEGLLEDAGLALESGAETTSLDRAYWYFLACWMGRNGTAGTERVDYQIAVRWTKNGGSPTVRFRNAVDSLPAWHRRLQNVVILRRDAFSIIDRFEDCPETAIYVDPHYPAETRSNVSGEGRSTGGGGGRYLFEFSHTPGLARDDDHARLAAALRAYKRARIVVSTYDCPRYRGLYDGWTFVDHSRQKNLHAQNGRGARPKQAPEVLIINGPSYAGGAG